MPIYLDNAATTPLAPEVRAAMEPFLGAEFGNPSSRHPQGVRAAEALDRARAQVALALAVRSEDVVFTSGGTEANNLAVLGIARAAGRSGRRVLVGPTEHPSVRGPALALRDEGFEVDFLRLDARGELDLADAAARLGEDVALVAQMLAQNEVGSVYPVRELARLVRSRAPRARLFVDAVQAFGQLDCSPAELGADAVSTSAHKVHGPKGAGALCFGRPVSLRPLCFGGSQERGLRPGTQNVAAAVGMGAAAEIAERERPAARARLGGLRRRLLERCAEVSGVRPLEPGGGALLPSIAAFELEGFAAEVCMHHLERRGIHVSAGAACQAAKGTVSPALLALGLSPERSRRVLRISLSRRTTPEEVEAAAAALAEVMRELEAAAQ